MARLAGVCTKNDMKKGHTAPDSSLTTNHEKWLGANSRNAHDSDSLLSANKCSLCRRSAILFSTLQAGAFEKIRLASPRSTFLHVTNGLDRFRRSARVQAQMSQRVFETSAPRKRTFEEFHGLLHLRSSPNQVARSRFMPGI